MYADLNTYICDVVINLIRYKSALTMNRKFFFLLIVFQLFCFQSNSQIKPIKEFENISRGDECVNCFFQDYRGLIWMGTNRGLFSYNGYSLDKNIPQASGDVINMAVNCSLKVDSTHFYLGCNSGILLFDIEKCRYTLLPATSSYDVRSMVWLDKHTILAGTMRGLIMYNTLNNTSKKIERKTIPYFPVYSIIKNRENVYISSCNGIYQLNVTTNKMTLISLPEAGKKKRLIFSLAEDIHNNCIWIGTEGELFKYNLNTKSIELIPFFSNNSIKSISTDYSGHLWMGTDNGLYIYNPKNKTNEYFVHTIKNNKSLINNIIWAVFEDREKNMWLGTDCGISLYRTNTSLKIHRWDEITGSDEGNRLTCIFRDSHKNYWLGGTNGIACYNPDKQKSVWYKMRGGNNYISHNRIRSIYEDRNKNIWVATDGGINHYNSQTERFKHYSIMEKSATRNANWAYGIFDDSKNKLWIGTYLGGLFMVDKQKLISSGGDTYLADRNYYMNGCKNGLLCNDVLINLKDRKENPVLIIGNKGINRINVMKNSVERIPYKPKNTVVCAIFDKDGFLWLGMKGSIDRLNVETGKVQSIDTKLLQNMNISSMTEENNHIWVTASEGVFLINKTDFTVKHVNLGEQLYFSGFYDAFTKKMLLGGIDHYIEFSPDKILKETTGHILAILTSVYVNDERINTGQSYTGNVILKNSIGYTKKIVLKNNQNNLVFEFSDLLYGKAVKSRYVYKLDGSDKEWRNLDASPYKISYSNLSPGDYTLYIQKNNDNGANEAALTLSIVILHPWYSTILAKIIYFSIIVWLFMWALNYYRVRNRLKIERIQREKTLELSNMKMDFLTNISHELKTPLSLILSPVSKLLDETRNPQVRSHLQMIHKNVIRLNNLVHQMIDFRDVDPSQSDVVLSNLEIVEFIKSILEVHREAFDSKHVALAFETNVSDLYIDADIQKMESIINNLISNAYKFSKENGAVKVELSVSEDDNLAKKLHISVIDNGCGIPERDLPYIFNRFYQSKENLNMNSEGSGIGLSIVKNYIELFHGHIKISSIEGEGTAVIIELPIISSDLNIQKEDTRKSIIQDEIQKYKILIVEDNVEIARFISENLINSVCMIAHNGKMGIEMAIKHQPDIIIADVMMPIMDGLEMSRLLKHNIVTATIPIIMLTAKDDKRTETQAFNSGVEAFISKPFDIKQLTTRIEQLINSKKLLINKLRQATVLEDKPVDIQSQDEKFILNITQIIEDRLAEPDLNVQYLADSTGISAKQVYRKIKLLTGHTAVDYIKFIRLKKAAILLGQKKFTIAEVMYMVGFSNHSYFSKCFSEKYGKTPKEFMESTDS